MAAEATAERVSSRVVRGPVMTSPMEPEGVGIRQSRMNLDGPFRRSAAVAAGLLTRDRLYGPRFQRLLPDVYGPADAPAGAPVPGRSLLARPRLPRDPPGHRVRRPRPPHGRAGAARPATRGLPDPASSIRGKSRSGCTASSSPAARRA